MMLKSALLATVLYIMFLAILASHAQVKEGAKMRSDNKVKQADDVLEEDDNWLYDEGPEVVFARSRSHIVRDP